MSTSSRLGLLRVAAYTLVALPAVWLLLMISLGDVTGPWWMTVLGVLTILMVGVLVHGAGRALAQALDDRDQVVALLDSCLSAAPVAFVIVDPDGRLRRWNQAVARLQLTDQDLRPGLDLEQVGLPPEVDDMVRTTLASGERRTTMVCGRDDSHWSVESFPVLVAERTVGVATMASDVTERRRSELRLAHLATHDPLTGLANRSLFTQRLTDRLEAGTRVGVLWCDVDYFKVLNDALGHGAGDALLVELGQRLLGVVSSSHDVARIGGDEFAVLVDGAWEEAHRTAEAMCAVMRKPFDVDGRQVTATISIGVAVAGYRDTPDSLLRDADVALYQAKERGRDQVAVYDDGARAALEQRLSVGEALRKALDDGEISVAYQPVLHVDDGRISAFEALARWRSSTLGEVPPSQFIPLAEDLGLIDRLGEQVLREACAQVSAWRHVYDPDLRVAVNVSGRQLDHAGLLASVRQILTETDLAPDALELEVTESVLMRDLASTFTVLDQLHDDGVHIALDDFGTGYSSLAYLQDLPIDTIKVDRSFTRRLPADSAMFSQLIALAAVAGSRTVAEGVETLEQWKAAELVGTDLVQGFLFAQPMPAAAAEAWLADHQASRR